MLFELGARGAATTSRLESVELVTLPRLVVAEVALRPPADLETNHTSIPRLNATAATRKSLRIGLGAFMPAY